VTGIGDGAAPPAASYLEQNTPNPFAAATRIAFGLREAADVSLVVYDVSGRVVRVLAQGPRAAERHEVEWDGRDEHHRPVASGVYFLKMKAGAFTQTRKMVVAR
jgi:flagellar hook assembly protein FlgD